MSAQRTLNRVKAFHAIKIRKGSLVHPHIGHKAVIDVYRKDRLVVRRHAKKQTLASKQRKLIAGSPMINSHSPYSYTKRGMRMGRSCLASALFCLVITSSFANNTFSQTRIAIQMPQSPRVARFDGSSGKLAPELQPVVDANATFLGIMKGGDAVFELPESVSAPEVTSFFLSTQRVAKILPDTAEFMDVRVLIIFVKELKDDLKFAGLQVIRKHDRGNFVAVETNDGVTPEILKALTASENVRYVMPELPGLNRYIVRD